MPTKESQRRRCLDARRALTPEQRHSYSHTICQKLISMPAVHKAQLIFSYIAAFDEVNLSVFHQWVRHERKTLAFPISGKAGIMTAHIPCDDKHWETGSFGILSPSPYHSVQIHPTEIDLVIVPCVGFDSRHNRLGHGAGYYDRYLALHPRHPTVALCYAFQLLGHLPTQAHDCPVDLVIHDGPLQGAPAPARG